MPAVLGISERAWIPCFGDRGGFPHLGGVRPSSEGENSGRTTTDGRAGHATYSGRFDRR
jgi:hypothetical protein